MNIFTVLFENEGHLYQNEQVNSTESSFFLAALLPFSFPLITEFGVTRFPPQFYFLSPFNLIESIKYSQIF